MGQLSSFYWKWFVRTIWQAPSIADGYAGLVGTFGLVASHYSPKVGQLMEPIAWQIPIWVFSAVLIFRFLHAPFQIWSEDQERLLKLASHENQKTIREDLAFLLSEGQGIVAACKRYDNPAPVKEADDWHDKTEAVLSELDQSYVARFNNPLGVSPMYADTKAGPEHVRIWSQVRFRCVRLHEIIGELAQQK
jgi:hypothetical protein